MKKETITEAQKFKERYPLLYYSLLEWKDENMNKFLEISEGKALHQCSYKTINKIYQQFRKENQ